MYENPGGVTAPLPSAADAHGFFLFGEKTSDFSEFMVCLHGYEKEVEPVRTF